MPENHRRVRKELKHYLTALLFILSSVMFLGCEKKCGCEAEPSRSVTNINATYHHPKHLHFLGTPELYYIICDENSIPRDILIAAKNAGADGIVVYVEGNIHNGCTFPDGSYIPNGITLTDIKLPEK
jgi:hypothetical protein